MTRFDRVTVASRSFTFAAVMGLAASTGNASALQSAVLLGATVLAAGVSTAFMRSAGHFVAGAEALAAALLIGFAFPDSVALLPYLVVPPLIAGAAHGFQAGVWTCVASTVGLLGIDLLSVNPFVVSQYTLVAPWILASAGAGLLGSLLFQLQTLAGQADANQSYESARRLLTQLRTVTRRLSAGLDPVGMSAHLLTSAHEHLVDTRSALFVRTEGGVLTPLGYRGASAADHLLSTDPIVEECWLRSEPMQARSGHEFHRYALPLRAGNRTLGVLIADAPQPPSDEALSLFMREMDDHAIRIDTALAFDEVRSLATVEERQRLAREIHDGVAQEVASLGYVIDELTAEATSSDQEARLGALRSEVTRVVQELRHSIFDLRSQVDPAHGIGSALSDYVRRIGSGSNLTVHLTLDESPTRLRGEIETELFRIAQEAITNARKHSDARNLWVHCEVDPPYARVEVRDDGSGLGSGRADSYGLKIMRERAERIGATLTIGNHSDGPRSTGTMVSVSVGGTRESGDRAADGRIDAYR